jgi:hypothetical protein
LAKIVQGFNGSVGSWQLAVGKDSSRVQRFSWQLAVGKKFEDSRVQRFSWQLAKGIQVKSLKFKVKSNETSSANPIIN